MLWSFSKIELAGGGSGGYVHRTIVAVNHPTHLDDLNGR